jgi:hypothetical protein
VGVLWMDLRKLYERVGGLTCSTVAQEAWNTTVRIALDLLGNLAR